MGPRFDPGLAIQARDGRGYAATMPTEIALLDGTKFQIGGSVEEFIEQTDPVAGWICFDEGDDAPKRYFNPATIAYVMEVVAEDGMPVLE